MDDTHRKQPDGLLRRIALLGAVALVVGVLVAIVPRLIPIEGSERVTFHFRSADGAGGAPVPAGLAELLSTADIVLVGTVRKVIHADPVEVELEVTRVLKGELGDRRHARPIEARGPVEWSEGEAVTLFLRKAGQEWMAVRATDR
jgi:hypothetical protein